MKKVFLSILILFAGIAIGQTNYVMSFNGSNSNINVGTSVGNGVRSIEFWFKPHVSMSPGTTSPGWGLITRNDNTQAYEYGAYIIGTDWAGYGHIGQMAFWVRYGGALHEIFSNQNTWIAGRWYHVAGVIDPVTGMSLYINGLLQTDADPGGTLAVMNDNINPTCLGSWGAGWRFFEGRMDEVRFWDRAISQSEIQAKMCQDLNPANETGLKGYYKCNEGSGTQVFDLTANGYTGTVYNAIWVPDSYCTNAIKQTSLPDAGSIAIYPNPSRGIVNIEIESISGIEYYRVYTETGEELYSAKLTTEKSEIDLSALSNGMYFVVVTQGAKSISKKIILLK